MRYRLYAKSKRAWDAMITEIKKAEKSVYLETYIFEPDTKESHDFLGILKKKAEDGVEIVIVADSFGSPGLKKHTQGLQKSNIEILFFSHWLRHIHRKICIIDEKTTFIGGVNIAKRFSEWNDIHLKLSGKRIAQRMLKSFSYSYWMAGGKNEKILSLRKKKISYKLKFWLVEHWPQRNVHTLRRTYEEKISQAKESVVLTTPYFAPPRWLISLLENAVKRGVSVELIIPEKVDLPLAGRVNMIYMEKMKDTGINFFLTKKMNHSKIVLIDSKEAVIGSQNLDVLSFGINMEAGIFFKDNRVIKDLLETIGKWKADSRTLDISKIKKTPVDYVIIALMKILKPIL